MKSQKPKSKENRLSDDEIRRMTDACKTEEETFIVFGLLYTGMRVSEFIHMARDWVDFDKGIIVVPEKQPCDCYECRSEGSLCKVCKARRPCGYWHPKTKSGARTIPLLNEIRPVFRSVLSEYHSAMEYVLNRVHVWNKVKEVARRAGIRHNVFPHAMRSTFASLMAERGLEPYYLKDLLGWTKINIAESYCKVSGTAMKKRIKEIW